MQKFILIVWDITEPVEISNSASTWTKDTSVLQKDNALYVDVLDYYTNLIKVFFKIPWIHTDMRGVDLVYESTLDNTSKLIDIKTQSNISDSLSLYMREFTKEKLSKRNYIIFNKKDKKLFWKIYFIHAKLIWKLVNHSDFSAFLKILPEFKELTHNYIQKDETLSKKYNTLLDTYNNKTISIDEQNIKIVFSPSPRKDKKWIAGNTCFLENIKLEISL